MGWLSQVLTLARSALTLFPDFVPYAHEMLHDGPNDVRPTGHLQIKGGPHGRVWYALWRDADGRHQKRLGDRRTCAIPGVARPAVPWSGGRPTGRSRMPST